MKKIIFVLIICICAGLAVILCINKKLAFPSDLNGKILMFGLNRHSVSEIDIASGTENEKYIFAEMATAVYGIKTAGVPSDDPNNIYFLNSEKDNSDNQKLRYSVYRYDVANQAADFIFGSSEPINRYRYDEKKIYYLANGEIIEYDIETDSARVIADNADDFDIGHGELLYGTKDGELYLYSLNTGNKTKIDHQPVAEDFWRMEFKMSPNGRYIAYRVSGEDIYIKDLSDGSERRISLSGSPLGFCFSPDGNYIAYTQNSRRLFFKNADPYRLAAYNILTDEEYTIADDLNMFDKNSELFWR